jgi:hypothetical protein
VDRFDTVRSVPGAGDGLKLSGSPILRVHMALVAGNTLTSGKPAVSVYSDRVLGNRFGLRSIRAAFDLGWSEVAQ